MSEWNWIAIVNFLAILLGPIVAIFVSKYIDRKNEIYKKRLEILENLYKFRGALLFSTHPKFAESINSLELFFYKHNSVIKCYKALLAVQKNENKTTALKEGENKLSELIFAMAKVLKIEYFENENNQDLLDRFWKPTDYVKYIERKYLGIDNR